MFNRQDPAQKDDHIYVIREIEEEPEPEVVLTLEVSNEAFDAIVEAQALYPDLCCYEVDLTDSGDETIL